MLLPQQLSNENVIGEWMTLGLGKELLGDSDHRVWVPWCVVGEDSAWAGSDLLCYVPPCTHPLYWPSFILAIVW